MTRLANLFRDARWSYHFLLNPSTRLSADSIFQSIQKVLALLRIHINTPECVYVTARGVRDTWTPPCGAARVKPRAICCFYDLEDHIYNNSVARAASSDTLSRLPSSVVSSRPRSLATGRRVLHHPNPRGVHEYEPGIHRRYTRVRY